MLMILKTVLNIVKDNKILDTCPTIPGGAQIGTGKIYPKTKFIKAELIN
jgi:hypothetical protein